MTARGPYLRALAVVALVATGTLAAGGATALDAAPDSSSELDSEARAGPAAEITAVQELRLTPERPGEITVTQRYELPDAVTALSVGLSADATVTSTDGFHAEGTTYEWDRRTAGPSLTYRLPANETGELRGPEGTDGRFLFVDAGEWALVERPRTDTSWRWSGGGRVELDRTVSVAGTGAVGSSTAFLGEHRELRSAAHGQTFRLIVPAAADLREPPAAVFDAFEHAAGALRVGDRDQTVFAVAAPSDRVRWGARGLQVGDADMWVLDDESLDAPDDTWTHEYVHTRQSWTTTPTAAWTTEAIATYYAALFALQDGRVSFDTFRAFLSHGTRAPYRDAVLADPTTWQGVRPDYLKGGLVFGDLDRRLRVHTEHAASAQSVVRRMNEHATPVNGSSLLSFVEAAGGEELRSAAERYTTTAAVPEVWTRAQHDEAFAPSPALIDVAIADRYRIAGPFRNGSAVETPVLIAVGETLSLDVRVENAGGVAGAYDVRFRVDGTVEARRSGQLEAGASTTLSFDRTFEEPGRYVVGVGTELVRVDVVRPATPAVVDVGASQTTVPVGGSVTVSATVTNDATIPGERTVVLRRDGESIDSRTVRLGPGESRRISFATALDAPGEYRFEVGDGSVVVTAEAPRDDDSTREDVGPTTAGDGGVAVQPGSVVAAAVGAAAVVLFVLLLRRRT